MALADVVAAALKGRSVWRDAVAGRNEEAVALTARDS